MKLSDLAIRTSPLTNNIYLGKIARNGEEWAARPEKVNITEQVKLAMIIHLMQAKGKQFTHQAGNVRFTVKVETEEIKDD